MAESVDLSRKIGAANEKQLDLLRRWHVHLLRAPLLPARERALAGKTLARLGDPRFDPERWFLPREPLLGFVEVPAGPFTMGERDERHEVTLPAFYIARYPVTVSQFQAFLAESGYAGRHTLSEEVSNHPVADVSWHDALAYCRWLTEKLRGLAKVRTSEKEDPSTQGFLRLLAAGQATVMVSSEAEWEKAARGTDGREYPWEGKADPERANYDDTGILELSTVGCFPLGASPYGCEELSGNVWEWTRSLYEDSEHEFDYPYNATDGRENLTTPGPRVLRGGAFYGISRNVRCAFRYEYDPSYRSRFIGFRVVVLPFFSDL